MLLHCFQHFRFWSSYRDIDWLFPLLLWLEQTHHPFIYSPLYGIHHEGSYTAYSQSSKEDAHAFISVGVLGDLK